MSKSRNTCDVCGQNAVTDRDYCWYHQRQYDAHGTPTPQCVAPGCTRTRGNGVYCKPHRKHINRYGTLEVPPHLPVEPLAAYFAAHGSYNAVLAANGYRAGTVEFDRMEKRILDAFAAGHLTVKKADLIAIEVLRVHPIFVWGDDWLLDVIDMEAAS